MIIEVKEKRDFLESLFAIGSLSQKRLLYDSNNFYQQKKYTQKNQKIKRK